MILSPPRRAHGDGIVMESWRRDEITAALLYWDAIEYPVNPLIEVWGDALDGLEELGVMSRSRVRAHGRFAIEEGLVGVADEVWRALEELSPGRWTPARRTGGSTVEGRTAALITLGLADALPLPSENQPYGEILEFKAKRRDELSRLRDRLGHLEQSVIQSADPGADLAAAISELREAANDARRVSLERFSELAGLRLKVSFNLTSAIRAGLVGAFGATAVGQSGLWGVGAAVINGVDISLEGRSRATLRNRPYQYLIEVVRELR